MIKKNVFRRFFIIVLPVLIIWCGIVIYNLSVEKNYVIKNLITENLMRDESTAQYIKNYMMEIEENMKLVRDSNELNDYVNNPTEKTKQAVSEMFFRVMNNKPDYDQMRYIDNKGNEIIRVNNGKDVWFTAQNELQNKGDRDYFTGTMMLSAGDFYISPFDLNMENGEIEVPYKPTIRFSTPIINSEEEKVGMLIINYLAYSFVDILSEKYQYEKIEDSKYYVLNKNGEFILHHQEEMNFSFMFDENASLCMSDEDEIIWEILQGNDHGSEVTDNRLITYYDVLQPVKQINTTYDEKWILVREMNLTPLFSMSSIMNQIFLTNNVFVFLLIIIFTFIIAMIVETLKRKDNQLEITRKIAETTNDAVIITQKDTTIIYINEAYENATGYSSSEVIGKKPSEFKSGKHDDSFYKKMWQSISEEGYWEGMLWDKKKDGLLYPKKLKIIAVEDKNGGTQSYIGIFSDLSTNKRKSDCFDSLKYSDGNFTLPNEEMMLELLDKTIQNKQFSFMVLYITIENYNQLISMFRDKELKTSELFIDLIKPLIHEEDFVAQTGRNLFSVIVDMQHIHMDPEMYVFKVHKELTKVMQIEGQNMFFKIRIGVSYWPNDADDVKKLLLNSIIALEWSALRRSSEIAFFSEKMIEQLNQENEIEGYLRQALEKEEFFIVYQPQVDSETNRMIGMEALLRWKNPKLGFVSPAVFIPIAEKNRLIIDIGNWVIKRVCEDIQYLNKTYNELMSGLRCAINLSPIQMEESGFLDKLNGTLNAFDVGRHQFEMEITEGLLLNNETRNISILEKMRNSGITIAIDDFGTGYSSMSYLNTMPIDKIKVDRTFIKNYPEYDDGKLAKILIEMAKSLELEVLTEGAETKEQVDYLKNIGCSIVQGYYYSKPLELEAFIAYLKKNIKN